MYKYRLAKYDPKLRDTNGKYLKKDWTSFDQIGKFFENKKFTLEIYEKYEQKYILVIMEFLNINKINKLVVTNLEKNFFQQHKNKVDNENLKELYADVVEGQIVDIMNIKAILQSVLRGYIWFKFLTKDEKNFIHFGWDMYVYFGSDRSLSIGSFNLHNLFLEEVEQSPYE